MCGVDELEDSAPVLFRGRVHKSSKPQSDTARLFSGKPTSPSATLPSHLTELPNRKSDHASYILQSFIPLSARPAFLALNAFNTTTSLIPSTTSNSSRAQMRFAFWRNALSSAIAEGNPPKGEHIALLLSKALSSSSTRQLQQRFLLRLLTARENRLTNPPFPSLASLETYAENTYGSLLYVTLSTLSASTLSTDHLASHIGKAVGLAAVLRGVPLLAFPTPPKTHSTASAGLSAPPQPTVSLPLDIMADCGVREEDVFRHGADAPGLSEAVFRVATRAHDHLLTAREMYSNALEGKDAGHAFEYAGEEGFEYPEDAEPPSESEAKGNENRNRSNAEAPKAFPALMPAVAVGLWLERLEKAGFNIFSEQLRRREWKLPWRAWWASRRGRF
jgi:NADH dehydrogenase [ubiquinone] 1 alpha subcomplex assembly factor 6